jgi:two-component system, cell cycle sensor histidine kinase and response regulator CckA
VKDIAELERKLADVTAELEALRARERNRERMLEQLYHFLAMVPDLLCVIGTDGTFEMVSPSFEHVLGHSITELLSTSYENLVHPADRRALTTVLRSAPRHDLSEEVEARVRTADGMYRTLRWRAVAADDDGRICALVRDITDMQRRVGLMEQTEATARVGGWELDLDTGEMYWTRETYRIHEVSAETYLVSLEGAVEFYTPTSRQLVETALERAFSRGEPFDLELDLVTASGKTICVRMTGRLALRDGRPIKAHGAIQDITDRKRAELAARELGALLTAAIEQSPAGMFVADAPDGEIRIANSAALGIRGPTSVPLTGIPLHQHAAHWRMFAANGTALSPEELPLSRAILHGETVRDVEIAIRRDSGEERRVLMHAAPVRDAEGRVVAGVVVFPDISDRKHLEEQLLHSQRLEGIGRLAGGVAHDFNNLLTVILGNAELLAFDLDDDGSPSRTSLDAIRAAAEHAASVTAQLLAFARRQIIEPRVVVLNTLFESIDQMLRRLLGENIELQIATRADTWPIRIDPGQFQQIVINLAVNARDAMPLGGRLVVAAENVTITDPLGAPREVEAGDYVRLQVTDTGEGMPAEVREHAFEPFFTTKPKGEGTGLGLSTCHGVVRQHGGHIWVRSTSAAGTSIEILFPRAHGEDAVLDSTSAALCAAAYGGSETLLLVEDEPMVLELAARTLSSRGYRILSASDGEEALLLAAEYAGPIDMLVTDVIMPRLNGSEVAERLLEQRPEMTILFTSGYTDDAIAQHGVLDDDVNFLQKPYRPDELARRVRTLLDEDATRRAHTAATAAGSR